MNDGLVVTHTAMYMYGSGMSTSTDVVVLLLDASPTYCHMYMIRTLFASWHR